MQDTHYGKICIPFEFIKSKSLSSESNLLACLKRIDKFFLDFSADNLKVREEINLQACSEILDYLVYWLEYRRQINGDNFNLSEDNEYTESSIGNQEIKDFIIDLVPIINLLIKARRKGIINLTDIEYSSISERFRLYALINHKIYTLGEDLLDETDYEKEYFEEDFEDIEDELDEDFCEVIDDVPIEEEWETLNKENYEFLKQKHLLCIALRHVSKLVGGEDL